MTGISLLFSFLVALFVSCRAATTVTVSGRKLLVNGQPWFVRGVCYSPTPIGNTEDINIMNTTNQATWQADVDRLKTMGANTIRVYQPLTGSGFTTFLDYLVTKGMKIILNYRYSFTTLGDANLATTQTNFKAVIDQYKNHDAVLMWAFDNEQNLNGNVNGNPDTLHTFVKNVITYLKANADSTHPYTWPVANARLFPTSSDTFSWVKLFDDTVDVWSYQVYNGPSFYTHFGLHANNSNKPMIITEYGVDAYSHTISAEDGPTHGRWMLNLAEELERNSVYNSNAGVCSGGTAFQYSDGWDKDGTPTTHTIGTTVNSNFFDGYADEEWFGILPAWAVGATSNSVTPRPAFQNLKTLWTTCQYSSTGTPTDNQILNPNFALGTGNWISSGWGGAAFSTQVQSVTSTSSADDPLTFIKFYGITTNTGNDHAQFMQLNIKVNSGGTYTYKFMAKADSARSLSTLIDANDGSWPPLSSTSAAVNGFDVWSLTTSWQWFTRTFTSPRAATSPRIMFEFASNAVPFYISKVYLSGGPPPGPGDAQPSLCTPVVTGPTPAPSPTPTPTTARPTPTPTATVRSTTVRPTPTPTPTACNKPGVAKRRCMGLGTGTPCSSYQACATICCGNPSCQTYSWNTADQRCWFGTATSCAVDTTTGSTWYSGGTNVQPAEVETTSSLGWYKSQGYWIIGVVVIGLILIAMIIVLNYRFRRNRRNTAYYGGEAVASREPSEKDTGERLMSVPLATTSSVQDLEVHHEGEVTNTQPHVEGTEEEGLVKPQLASEVTSEVTNEVHVEGTEEEGLVQPQLASEVTSEVTSEVEQTEAETQPQTETRSLEVKSLSEPTADDASASADNTPTASEEVPAQDKEWVVMNDTTTGKAYFYNTTTGVSQWENPANE